MQQLAGEQIGCCYNITVYTVATRFTVRQTIRVDDRMADWQTLALIHVLVGYEADLIGLVPFKGGGGKTANGLLITAFLFYTFVALIVSLQKFAELKLPEKIINIINIVVLILTG